MYPDIETRQNQSPQSDPAVQNNSPIAYGLGNFGLQAAFKVFAGYYMFFYVDGLGLAIALAAIINVVYALWDAVNDPLVGYLSDNTRTRWGRRKPWQLIALPFYVIFLILVYAVPDAFQGGDRLFWYALVVIFLFETVNRTFPGVQRTNAGQRLQPGFWHGRGTGWFCPHSDHLYPVWICAHGGILCFDGRYSRTLFIV